MKDLRSSIYKVKQINQSLNTSDSIDQLDYGLKAEQLINSKSFFFMDFESKDLRIIERLESNISDEEDQQTSKIGKNIYITSIENLSSSTQQMYHYLENFKNHNNNKQKIRYLINEQKNKLITSKNISINLKPQPQPKGDIAEYLNRRKMNQTTNKILKEQEKLSKNQGYLGNFKIQIQSSLLSHINLTTKERKQSHYQKFRKSYCSSKTHNNTKNTSKFPKITRMVTEINSKQFFF